MRDDYIHLFLDDSPERAAILHQRVPEKEIAHFVWVRTISETLDLLVNYRERLRDVYLDHNLGCEHRHSGSDESGMAVVRFLEHQNPKEYGHVTFIIHSWNLPAAKKMTERLAVKGYKVIQQPFGLGK